MASDLATALVSGQSPGLMADPALAAIAPQLQMGQALSQQGMSTAAAYPAQALGRLGQAFAGAYLTHDAQSQLTGLNAGSAESLQKIFPEGTPMGDALRSPSPLVKMLAMQNAGKSLLLNSESKTMGPNQVQVAPATPKYGGSITAMGSPALEGQVEAAKNPALINRAAGTAVAENPALIARAGGIESAKNPALIERAGGTAAAENPALIARAGGIETAKNPALVARAGDTAAAENPALIARAGGVEAAKNPALIARAGGEAAARAPNESGGTGVVQGPNGPVTIPITAETRRNMQPGQPSGPAGALTGEPVKTPEFQGNVVGQEKLYGGANEAIGKIIGEAIERGGSATRDKLHALDTMESALRAGGDHIVTGPLAEHALKAKQLMSSLGLDAGDLTKGLPETEVISKMNAQLASASAKAMTGRPTQAEFQIWMRNNPGLMTSKQGTLALIDVLRQQARQDTEFSKVAMNKKNWENFPEVADKWYQEHGGLINPLTHKPMRDEIPAAHAAPAGGGGAASTAAPAGGGGNTKLEAGKTVANGHLYLGGNPNNPNSWQIQKGDRVH